MRIPHGTLQRPQRRANLFIFTSRRRTGSILNRLLGLATLLVRNQAREYRAAGKVSVIARTIFNNAQPSCTAPTLTVWLVSVSAVDSSSGECLFLAITALKTGCRPNHPHYLTREADSPLNKRPRTVQKGKFGSSTEYFEICPESAHEHCRRFAHP